MIIVDEAQAVSWGQAVLRSESSAIDQASKKLNKQFFLALEAILACSGKVVTTGLGKSGYVARKLASTFSSTGTSAFYLHPAEALHGDFGMLRPNDCLVAIAYGGETREVVAVSRFAEKNGSPVIALTGKQESTLALISNIVLDGSVEKEADFLDIAPTASSTVALALCDALAVAVMRARGFSEKDFANLHPGGSLGKRFALVCDHMHVSADVGVADLDSGFHTVIESITNPNFGIVAIVDDGKLVGAISDGDLRRAFLKYGKDTMTMTARDLMAGFPKSIPPSATVMEAISVMEKQAITSVFVVDSSKLLGLVRLHDLITAKII